MPKPSTQKRLPGPLDFAAEWPHGLMPMTLWGARQDRAVLPIAIKQIKPSDFFAKTWNEFDPSNKRLPRYIGVLSYDEFCPHTLHKTPSLIYEVHESLVWNKPDSAPERIVSGNPKSCALKLDESALKELQRAATDRESKPIKGNTLFSTLSDDSYISMVRDIQSAIRDGTFYQLNLLRWFKFSKAWTWDQVCSRLEQHGGRFTCLFRHGNQAIASFSPERFVAVERESQGVRISTWPIKGTIGRSLRSEVEDQKQKQTLLDSAKDKAELHMIVDLMRNDLSRVCLPTTVAVTDGGSLKTFEHVHHLEAHITGLLDTSLNLGAIFGALCPGGSITGAPKSEVMKHIRAFEGRGRGFMMGHAFLMDADGTFDSNILIRTMTSSDACRTWDYAAGSGIVIKSSPEVELAEILSKCRPVTDS